MKAGGLAALCVALVGGVVQARDGVFFGVELPAQAVVRVSDVVPVAERPATFFGLPPGAEYSSNPTRRINELFRQSEDLRRLEDEWERFWMIDHPSHLTYDRVDGSIQ